MIKHKWSFGGMAITANVLQLCETALNKVYVKPFCITFVIFSFEYTTYIVYKTI